MLPTRGAVNDISDKAAEAISAALLQETSSLKSIKLHCEFFNDVLLLLCDQLHAAIGCWMTLAGIKAICASLKLNDTLTSIDLSGMWSDANAVCLPFILVILQEMMTLPTMAPKRSRKC